MTLRHVPAHDAWVFDPDDGSGKLRTLREPHGPPTRGQLRRLMELGLLEIRDVPGQPFTKLDAARAIDQALQPRVDGGGGG